MKKSAANEWSGNPYKRPGSPFWSIVFTDAAGVVRRKSTKTRDLRIARDALAAQLREVELQKTGHVDHFAESRTVPIEQLVVAFREHLETADSAPRYVRETMRQIRHFIKFAKVTTVPSITIGDAETMMLAVPVLPNTPPLT